MNTRVFVHKKKAYQVETSSMLNEFVEKLGITSVEGLSLYNVYDIFNADENDIALLKSKVLSEVVTDEVFDELDLSGKTYVAYESLPGQFDQRADAAQECLMLLNNKQGVTVKSGRIVVLKGNVSEEEVNKIKKYLINPVEMREKDLSILELNEDVTIEPVEILHGFIALSEDEIKAYRNKEGLAMTWQDLAFIQKYFKEEEKRDPSITEIKVLDTYWSDSKE